MMPIHRCLEIEGSKFGYPLAKELNFGRLGGGLMTQHLGNSVAPTVGLEEARPVKFGM